MNASPTPSILVLEDEAGFRTLLAEVLASAGHLVQLAPSAAEAWPLIQQHDFDVLLLDYRLPGTSGLEFLQQFRAAGRETPVIIMTAYADVPVVVEAMRLGAIDFLVKPFQIDALLPLVDRCMQLQASRTAGAPPPQ
jgi:DNA-binding NtrC family response regulator